MRFKRIIAAIVGVTISWMLVTWPVRAMAKVSKLNVHNQMVMGDDDDDPLPPPPFWIPTPDSYTPGGNG